MINEINIIEKQKEEMIKALGVFELRGLARQLGVSSPTTKRRDELIALILEASRNGKSFDDGMPKRGRPYKRLNILDSITNKITPDVTGERMDFVNLVRFSQEVAPVHEETVDDEIYVFDGVLRRFDDNAVINDMKTNTIVYVFNDTQYYEKFESGDRVKVEAKKLVGQSHYVASKILEINDTQAEEYQPIAFEQGEEIIENETLVFGDGKMGLGRRNIYKIENDLFENADFDKFYKECNDKNIHFIMLAINTSYENQIKFKSLNIKDNFTTVYGTNNDINFNKIVDVVFYAMNLVARGEKVVVFVSDIVETIRSLDACFENRKNEEHSPKAKIVMQKLLSFARAYSSGVSGTLFMCYNESDLNDKFLTNEVLKISKKVN